jgi:hypothetical protein
VSVPPSCYSFPLRFKGLGVGFSILATSAILAISSDPRDHGYSKKESIFSMLPLDGGGYNRYFFRRRARDQQAWYGWPPER